jgi:hypothetical protein
MTKQNQAHLFKLNEASQYREECEKSEKRVKRSRNLLALFFIISIFLIIGSQGVLDSAFKELGLIKSFVVSLPIVEYALYFVGMASFLLFMTSVFKAISIQSQTEKARKLEGRLAQNIFRLTLMSTNNG